MPEQAVLRRPAMSAVNRPSLVVISVRSTSVPDEQSNMYK
jgi:hypothetical protein